MSLEFEIEEYTEYMKESTTSKMATRCLHKQPWSKDNLTLYEDRHGDLHWNIDTDMYCFVYLYQYKICDVCSNIVDRANKKLKLIKILKMLQNK